MDITIAMAKGHLRVVNGKSQTERDLNQWYYIALMILATCKTWQEGLGLSRPCLMSRQASGAKIRLFPSSSLKPEQLQLVLGAG